MCVCLILATAFCRASEPPVPSGVRFKDLVPCDGSVPFLVGASISDKELGTPAEVILNREFQFLSPANEFKQTAIHPQPGVWNWKKSDKFVEYCTQRGYLMRLHAPISPQCSEWAEEDNRTPQELQTNLEEYVTEVCLRYNGKPHIRWMDVVNETITNKGEWFGPKPGTGVWQNPWTQIGFDESHSLRPPLYIKRAFELANQHAPDIKLLINQHSGMEPAMWEKVRQTVLYLREQGLRVDGIGWQAHVDSGFEKNHANMQMLNSLIDWAHENKLEFHVTENTVWTIDKDQKAQAATYAAIVRTLLEHRNKGVVTWNAWQLCDGDTQKKREGTLFDEQGVAKPSYYAVQRELKVLKIATPAAKPAEKSRPRAIR